MEVEDVIDFLNKLIKLDREAIENLINARVSCNTKLAMHSTVQVRDIEGECYVGFLGMLNGMFGIRGDGLGHIQAIYNDCDKLVKFSIVGKNAVN